MSCASKSSTTIFSTTTGKVGVALVSVQKTVINSILISKSIPNPTRRESKLLGVRCLSRASVSSQPRRNTWHQVGSTQAMNEAHVASFARWPPAGAFARHKERQQPPQTTRTRWGNRAGSPSSLHTTARKKALWMGCEEVFTDHENARDLLRIATFYR
jgi:hypothetical protein